MTKYGRPSAWEAELSSWEAEIEQLGGRGLLSQSESQNSASHLGLTDRPPKFPENLTFDSNSTSDMKYQMC